MEIIDIRPQQQRNRTPATKARTAAKQPTTQKSPKRRNFQGGGKLTMFRHVADQTIVRRVLRNYSTVNSSAGGAIVLATGQSTGITSAPDWNNISQEFANYRVRRIKWHLVPSTVNATSTTGPYQGMCFIGRWWGKVPTASSNVEQSPGTIAVSTLEEVVFENNFQGYPLAQEWTIVGNAIATNNVYGLVIVSVPSTSTLAVSSNIYSIVTEFEVEFLAAS